MWCWSILLSACTDQRKEKGEILTRQYCASCHAYSAPELLPKEVWAKSILPKMGAFLGVKDPSVNPYEGVSYDEQLILIENNVYPSRTLIAEKDWQQIQQFILENAPDSLPTIEAPPPEKSADYFRFNGVKLSNGNSMVTLTKFDTTTKNMYVGFQNGQLIRWDLSNDEQESLLFTSPVIDLDRLDEAFIFSLIGYMHPSEMDFGAILNFSDWKKQNRIMIIPVENN